MFFIFYFIFGFFQLFSYLNLLWLFTVIIENQLNSNIILYYLRTIYILHLLLLMHLNNNKKIGDKPNYNKFFSKFKILSSKSN